MLFENFENTTRNSIYKGDLPNNKIYCTSVKGKKDILILLFIITIKLLEYLMFLLLQIMILIIFKY